MKDVGKRIASLRKSKKMTQAELAELLNISHQSVSKWERSESYPDISMLIELRKVFNTTIDYILVGEGNSENDISVNQKDLRNYLISALDKNDNNLDLDTLLEKLPSIDLRDILVYALDKGKKDFDLSKAVDALPSIDLRDVLLVAVDHGKFDFQLKKVFSRLRPSEFEDLANAIESDGIDTNLDIELLEMRSSKDKL